MLSYEEALEKCLETVPVFETEEVALEDALGRFTADSIISDIDMPAFDRSAMDGFAVRADDIQYAPVTLKVVGTIPAGEPARFEVGRGEAAHIMTGAPMPLGADTVVMVEDARYDESRKSVEILKPIAREKNICYRGEDVKAGAVALNGGDQIAPKAIPLLASAGAARVRVHRRPTAAIVTTGSELVDISEKPGAGQIRDSNLHALRAQLRKLGIEPANLGVIADEEEAVKQALQKGLEYEVLIISGGVSMGKFDIIAEVLTRLGAETVFHGVAVKPGKPMLLARKDNCTIFGLPGNPVSTFVSFLMFVRPGILKMMAASQPRPRFLPATLSTGVKMEERMKFLPGVLAVENNNLMVEPIEWHGSGDVSGLARCECLIVIPPGKELMRAGKVVEFYPLPD